MIPIYFFFALLIVVALTLYFLANSSFVMVLLLIALIWCLDKDGGQPPHGGLGRQCHGLMHLQVDDSRGGTGPLKVFQRSLCGNTRGYVSLHPGFLGLLLDLKKACVLSNLKHGVPL